VTFVLWGLLFSSLFRVTEVEFIGIEGVKFPTFVDKGALENLRADVKGSNSSLVVYNIRKLGETAAQIPGIKDATTAKVWPHKVVVIIEPREPLGRIGNKLIDVDGEVLGDAPPDIYYPEMIAPKEIQHDVLLLLNSLRADNLDIKSITANTRDDITVAQKNGFTIVFGNINQLTLKLADVHRLLAEPIVTGKTVLDVSAPKAPIVR
jgi:cell division protein FtsQ